jgi:hypothetical protein
MTAVWFNPNKLQDPSADADLTVADWDDFMRHVLESIPSPKDAAQQGCTRRRRATKGLS